MASVLGKGWFPNFGRYIIPWISSAESVASLPISKVRRGVEDETSDRTTNAPDRYGEVQKSRGDLYEKRDKVPSPSREVVR